MGGGKEGAGREEQELSPEDRALLERLARWIVERRMAVPAVLFIESSKPMSFVGSQAMHFFEPMVKAFLSAPEYRRMATLLEDRANLDRFVELIETLDDGARAAEREARRRRRDPGNKANPKA